MSIFLRRVSVIPGGVSTASASSTAPLTHRLRPNHLQFAQSRGLSLTQPLKGPHGHEQSPVPPSTSNQSKARRFPRKLTIGIFVATSLYLLYRSLHKPVPITNRRRLIWESPLDYGKSGYLHQNIILSKGGRRFTDDSHAVRTIRSILDRLLDVDMAKGVQVQLFLFDEFDAPNAHASSYYPSPTESGGTIFINTGCLLRAKTIDEVAGVLAHELAHILARHVAEARTSKWFAGQISRAFGYKGDLPSDLETSRLRELEADHIGLIVMAQAGFDPQKRLENMTEATTTRLIYLKGTQELPEFLSTHPSNPTRIKALEAILPKANAIFEKKRYLHDATEKTLRSDWVKCKKFVEDEYINHKKMKELQTKLNPENLLKHIDARLAKLENLEQKLLDGFKKIKAEHNETKEKDLVSGEATTIIEGSMDSVKQRDGDISPGTVENQTPKAGEPKEKGTPRVNAGVIATKSKLPPVMRAPVAAVAASAQSSTAGTPTKTDKREQL